MVLSGSPLSETLELARERFGGHDVLATRIGRPDGWTTAAQLARPGQLLDDMLVRQTIATGTERADIGGTWLVEAYAWALAMRAVGLLLLGGRVPALPLQETCLDIDDDGTIMFVALAGAAYALPADPRMGHPALRAVASEDALLAVLCTELEAQLTPLIDALAPAAKRAPAALWRSAGDRLGGAFLWLGEVLGARDRAWSLGSRCLADAGPLTAGAEFRVIEHAGVSEATRNRDGCCLMYRTGDRTTCFTCPLTPEAERLDRLEARVAGEHDAES